jgi:hypothetical protein
MSTHDQIPIKQLDFLAFDLTGNTNTFDQSKKGIYVFPNASLLPISTNFKLVNGCFTNYIGKIRVYKLTDTVIDRHKFNVSWRKFYSINTYGDEQLKLLKQLPLNVNTNSYFERIEIDAFTIPSFMVDRSIEQVNHLYIKANGHEKPMLLHLIDFWRLNPDLVKYLRPLRITFDQTYCNQDELKQIVNLLAQFNYIKLYVEKNMVTLVRTDFDWKSQTASFVGPIVGHYIPGFPIGYDPANPQHENTLESAMLYSLYYSAGGVMHENGRYTLRLNQTPVKIAKEQIQCWTLTDYKIDLQNTTSKVVNQSNDKPTQMNFGSQKTNYTLAKYLSDYDVNAKPHENNLESAMKYCHEHNGGGVVFVNQQFEVRKTNIPIKNKSNNIVMC